MPLSDILSFSYGDYEFSPRPLVTINKEYIKTAGDTGVATKYALTLNGSLIETPVDELDEFGGVNDLFTSISDLREAFQRDFHLLHLGCVGTPPPYPPIISGYPKILSMDFSPKSDNYVQQTEYTINLELPTLVGTGFEPVGVTGGYGDLSKWGLLSVSDEFSVEFLDERAGGDIGIAGFSGRLPSVFSVQRTLSAQGETLGTGQGGVPVDAWRRAKNWITDQLSGYEQGFPPEATGISGLMCLGTGLNYLNQFRNVSVNKVEGTCNASVSFVAASGYSYEDMDVSIDRSADNPYITVTINGAINGLANLSGTYNQCGDDHWASEAKDTKFKNALNDWPSVSGAAFSRAEAVYDTVPRTKFARIRNLNIWPLTETIGYNMIAGTVSYSNTYDDRPYNCYTGALTETINITETNPNDIFASLTVLGRANGPLLQQIGTVGPTVRDISIDAMIPIQTGCDITNIAEFFGAPDVYDTFIQAYRDHLELTYAQVFINSQGKTWEPKMGHFTQNISFTVGSC